MIDTDLSDHLFVVYSLELTTETDNHTTKTRTTYNFNYINSKHSEFYQNYILTNHYGGDVNNLYNKFEITFQHAIQENSKIT
jgi:hypothetical protein